jgi:citrate synthase
VHAHTHTHANARTVAGTCPQARSQTRSTHARPFRCSAGVVMQPTVRVTCVVCTCAKYQAPPKARKRARSSADFGALHAHAHALTHTVYYAAVQNDALARSAWRRRDALDARIVHHTDHSVPASTLSTHTHARTHTRARARSAHARTHARTHTQGQPLDPLVSHADGASVLSCP